MLRQGQEEEQGARPRRERREWNLPPTLVRKHRAARDRQVRASPLSCLRRHLPCSSSPQIAHRMDGTAPETRYEVAIIGGACPFEADLHHRSTADGRPSEPSLLPSD